MLMLMWNWRPIPGVVWDFRQWELPAVTVRIGFVLGWLALVVLRVYQVFKTRSRLRLDTTRGKLVYLLQHVAVSVVALTNPTDVFALQRAPFLLRHPVMLSLAVVFWATPLMTAGHLVLAFAMSVHVLMRIQVEEILLNRRAAHRLLEASEAKAKVRAAQARERQLEEAFNDAAPPLQPPLQPLQGK
eukprot:TRINITY_DN8266_c0_g1_i1.p2 TRINITY_DN8266_c0_g1~~TRINITY_DN8266_c0_g1_i1.p2  ORF type:complete len:187 (-),score=56.10 TRINITY_DN8266_c0_g1_i1:925-1485(-)